MKLTIEIPDAVQRALVEQVGEDFDMAAKQTLAIAWYQAGKLSIGQVAELLGTSVYEAEGLMKEHGVAMLYSVEDYESDRQAVDRAIKP